MAKIFYISFDDHVYIKYIGEFKIFGNILYKMDCLTNI